MAINARGITYAIGKGADRATLYADEGIEPYARPVITPVLDNTRTPRTFKTARGVGHDDYSVGTIYYQTTLPLTLRPANLRLILDHYFENGTVGASPDYARDYDEADIPSHPGNWLSLWERTEYGGDDNNNCYYGGVVHGLRFSQVEGGVVKCDVIASFMQMVQNTAFPAGGSWEAEAGGDREFWRGQDVAFTILVGTASLSGGYKDWGINISHEIQPTFYATQYPDRITRRAMRIDGHFTVRDDGSRIQKLIDAQKDGTDCFIQILNGSQYLRSGFVIINYQEIFEKNTRFLKVQFTNVVEGANYNFGFGIYLKPQVA